MEPLISSAYALRQVLGARNSFFLAQVPVIDLAELASTEVARLDFPESRARRLCDQVALDVPLTDAARIYSVTDAFVSSANTSRRLNRGASESESEPTDEQRAAELARATANSEWDALVQEFDIDVSKSLRLLATASKMQLEQPRGALMLQSLLITSVAQFETFVSRLIVTSLRHSPAALNSSGKSLTFSDVFRHESLREFVRAEADAFVDTLMRKGMDEWLKFLKSATRCDLDSVADELAEVVLRRNAHVHTSGRANSDYIAKLGKRAAAVKLNAELPVTKEYLLAALDDMAVAVICLSQAAITALRASSPKLRRDDLGLVQETYEFLMSGRYKAAAAVYARVEQQVPEAGSREMIRANSYYARRMLHGISEVRKDVEDWDVSSSAGEFVLVRLCLLGDIDQAKTLYKQLSERGIVGVSQLATWPILSELRDAIAADGDADRGDDAEADGGDGGNTDQDEEPRQGE